MCFFGRVSIIFKCFLLNCLLKYSIVYLYACNFRLLYEINFVFFSNSEQLVPSQSEPASQVDDCDVTMYEDGSQSSQSMSADTSSILLHCDESDHSDVDEEADVGVSECGKR